MSDIEVSRLSELETVVEAGLQTFYDVGAALIEIRDSRLYRQDYDTWQDYCRDRWGFNYAHANRMINAFEIAGNLTPLGVKPELVSESQLRPLKPLSPEEQREAWQRAIETAPDGNVNKITRGHVQAIVDDMRGIDRTSETQIEQAEPIEYETKPVSRPLGDEPENNLIDEPVPAPIGYTDFNYKRDMRSNQKADEHVSKPFDFCQTPPYALAPLLPFLKPDTTIWEPAVGEGNIAIELEDKGFSVVISDILRGQNFFEYAPDSWDAIVTNPPYSLKYRWLKRCYELGKPFALLIPVETLGAKTAQEMMQEYGFEVMLLNRRVSFKMPNKGWEGGGAQFSTMWFCWQVLPQPIMFGDIQYPSATEVEDDDEIY